MALSVEQLRLMSNIRVAVPGALDDAIRLELFNTLDQFLQETNFWQEEIDFTVTSGVMSYVLTPTEPGSIIALLAHTNAELVPVRATMALPGTVDLVNDPLTGEVYTATVSMTVVDPVDADDMPEMPDGLLLKYGAGITSGVIGRMMAQPAKPYTNERMGIYNTRLFRGTIANARSAVLHKNIQGGQTWRFPRTFKSGSQR